MKKIALLFLLLLILLPNYDVIAQRRLEIGTVVKIMAVGIFDDNYSIKDKLINKTGTVSNKILANMGGAKDGVFNPSGPYAGEITIEGKPYNFLDVSLEVLKKEMGPTPVSKDKNKLRSGLGELMNYFTENFKSIRTTKAKTDYYPVTEAYYSSFALQGSKDGSNTVFYQENNRSWNFKTLIDPDIVSSKEITTLLDTTSFNFGKLEKLQEKQLGELKDYYYVPVDRKKTGNKFKNLTVHLHVVTYDGKEVFLQLSILNYSFENDISAASRTSQYPVSVKDPKKLETQFKQLMSYFQNEFANIRSGKQIVNSDRKQTYRSTFLLNGAHDSGIVFFDTTSAKWNFEIQMNSGIYSSKDISQVLENMAFPFGKLEKQKLYAGSSTITYLPENRSKLKTKFKDLSISIFYFESSGIETYLQINVY